MAHDCKADLLPNVGASADVAVCTLMSRPDRVRLDLDRNRVGLVAPLASRSDLDGLLRTLGLHPNLRHLVVCGDDLRSTGESLVALWNEGLDHRGQLPGSRGVLGAELDAETVDALRERVKLQDWREKTCAEVSSAVRDLPCLAQDGEVLAVPIAGVPKRKTFLSRKTSFPIFTSDVGDAWLQLLNLTLRIGTVKQTAGGDRMAEALNAVVTVELPAEEGEHPPFLDFNAEDFDAYYRRLRSPTTSESAAPSWARRLGSDRLDAAIDRLRRSPDTADGTVVLLEPGELAEPREASSVVSATFNVVEGRLFGSFVLRAVDVYEDWPFESLSLVRLHREVAGRLGLQVGTATFVVHSAYLRERDWARSLRVLEEFFKRPLPLRVDPSGVFLFGNDGGKARAMLLDHDANTIFWEEAFDDPEDLSWYIVDVMPWLLPQHIRYVGQECASLMRAIREKECYLQG